MSTMQHEYDSKVKTLLLAGEQDKDTIPRAILIEDVTVRTDLNVQHDLLLEEFDTVIITKGFSRTNGNKVCNRIVKLLHTLTKTRIHYLFDLEHTGGNDEVSNYMRSLGIGNIGRADLGTLEVDEFRKIVRTDTKITPPESDTELMHTSNLELMRSELRTLSDTAAEAYVKRNRSEIMDLISNHLNLLEEREILVDEYSKTLVEKENYKQMSEEYHTIMKSLEYRHKATTKDLNSLRRIIISEKSKIDEYNSRLVNDVVADSPVIDFDITAPVVIYFKEIEDIGFFNFYQSILYTLRDVYKLNVKSLILEPHSRHFYDPYTELGYITVPDSTTMSTIIENDDFIKYGNPTTLLQSLSDPQFKLDLILVYDRTRTDNIMIRSNHLIPFYLGDRMERVKTLAIDPVSWISPTEGQWRNVKPLMYQKPETDADRITYTSIVTKHPLTRFIVDLLDY